MFSGRSIRISFQWGDYDNIETENFKMLYLEMGQEEERNIFLYWGKQKNLNQELFYLLLPEWNLGTLPVIKSDTF